LYINGVKCEWVKVGFNESTINNAVQPKPENIEKGYYQPGIKSGVTITVELRDIKGKAKGHTATLRVP
jgi:hypothetical protein